MSLRPWVFLAAVSVLVQPPGAPGRVYEWSMMYESKDAVKLNLGAGDKPIEGFVPIDRKAGGEVYPLDAYADESVDEIYASHILEHFDHCEIEAVLGHWVRKLKPGGRIRIAVPDFAWIAKHYLDGEPINTQGYVMGGNVDANDKHGCIFDVEMLTDLMLHVGLERIGPWAAEYDDCASLPVSLNLQGFKPTSQEFKPHNMVAVLSAPRFAPVAHFRCCVPAFSALGIPYEMGQGAYWQQVWSEQVEALLGNEAIEYILSLDYDTVFTKDEVMELWRLAKGIADADAVCPIQCQRASEYILAGRIGTDGVAAPTIRVVDMAQPAIPVTTGHFGLTVFKAEALRKLPRPWMMPKPAPDGRWATTKVDADISFWHNWRDAGLKLYLATRVVVGHMEETIKWPGRDFKPVYQPMGEFFESGIPAEVQRC